MRVGLEIGIAEIRDLGLGARQLDDVRPVDPPELPPGTPSRTSVAPPAAPNSTVLKALPKADALDQVSNFLCIRIRLNLGGME